MKLTMYLICVICGAENGTNGCRLDVFSVDVAFATALWLSTTPIQTSIRVLVVLAMPVKALKMADNSVSNPFNSCCMD